MSRYVSEAVDSVSFPSTNRRSPFLNRVVYDSPGSYCFTVPSGVCTLRVVTVGSGAASCRRVGPDTTCISSSLCCSGVPDVIICGHDGFHYKRVFCARPVSTCADYCNCGACGSLALLCGIFCCTTNFCNICSSSVGYISLKSQCGVAGAGTTVYYESCYLSGQSIIGPSGGYADGCLSVTPGCSFTVTVGCSGGSSGFGTFISATGGSVSITQKPQLLCHPYFNACYIGCGLDSGTTPVSFASSIPICCCVYLINDTHCFSYTYQNCCAQATLTAGVGTAWEGMSNVIVRSGAAGTIFHPIEYSFTGCITGSTSGTIFSSVPCWNYCTVVGFGGTTACNCYVVCRYNECGVFGYSSDIVSATITPTSEHKYIERCWGGASAGNYFGDGINQSDYDDIVSITSCSSACILSNCVCLCCNCWSICSTAYAAGPLLTCCGDIYGLSTRSGCICVCVTLNSSFPASIYYYGSPGGAGIISPGTRCLAGSGKAPSICASNCIICNGSSLSYSVRDDVNGPSFVQRIYPQACSSGPICCRIYPDSISGSTYWYPEDMNGHSSIIDCFSNTSFTIQGQPGGGGGSTTCCCLGLCPGILGGSSVVHSCSNNNIVNQSTPCSVNITNIKGSSVGYRCTNIFIGGNFRCVGDRRCDNYSSGLVIVYY